MTKQLVPSLLSFPTENWNQYFNKFKETGINTIHFDVMDFDYVQNEAFNKKDFLNFLSSHQGLKADVHLMVTDPWNIIDDYLNKQTTSISFHFDVLKHPNDVLKTIKKIQIHQIKAGIAISPNFSFQDIKEYLPYCDFVLVMGVYPGRGGQEFIPSTLETLNDLYQYKLQQQNDLLIHIDGGMNKQTIPLIYKQCDLIVAGSFLYKNLNDLKEIYSWFSQL